MSHPQRQRVAAVFGRSQGSGYLLTPWLVLTAAHVVGEDPAPDVVVPDGVGRVRCRVLWSRYDEACDAALLLAAEDLVPGTGFREFSRLFWGRLDDLAPRAGAHAVGYPQVQRDGADELDSEQLVGTLKPASGMLRGRQVLDSLHRAPDGPGGGRSPWAGFSGAPVFVDDHLVGVVRSDPTQWQHSRLEITPAAVVLDSPDLHRAAADANHNLVWMALSAAPAADDFETRLRDYVVRQCSTLHIIGMSRGSDQEQSWPLDTSYLSLELLGGSPTRDVDGSASPAQRAEQALSGHRRMLVRGSAGSGKTTLLQWLATATARRELPPSLGDLADCVPLLIRLRAIAKHGELPAPEEFLFVAAKPLAGHARAAGWVTEQLERGRILLLVDGVDEVPEADRARTRAWLTDLMDAYPDARYVVTTRPSAVREGWLAPVGFTELELQPMSRADVAAFIARWHAAAGTGEQYERWRDTLTAAVVSKPDLGRLATSPLMCALVCALNRDRNGYLPQGRMELYAAALEMLLVRRDRERDIVAPAGLELTVAQQSQLLQRLAYWLARNGAVEIDSALAVRKLEEALPAMPGVTAGSEEVLHHLLVRSGLLRRPTVESVDFVHRTFQDYLAAKAAVEDEDFGLLVANAHDDQWEDVIRMAVGHGRPRERTRLLRGLLARAVQDPAHRNRLRLLAATCLEHASELDPAVRQQVTLATAALVPPRNEASAKELATVGPLVLDLLPGPEGLDDETARAVVITATNVAGERALPLLSRYVDHPYVRVRGQLAWAWDRFPAQEYGEQIVARLSRDGFLRYVTYGREHLEFLHGLDGPLRLECSGPLTQEDLDRIPPDVRELRIHDNPHPFDLSGVLARSAPQQLWLSDCPGRISLAPVAEHGVRELYLHWNTDLVDAAALARAEALTTFAIASFRPLPELWLPPGLTHLHLGQSGLGPDNSTARLLRGTPALEYLYADAERFKVSERGVLRDLPQLRKLRILSEYLGALSPAEPLPDVTELQLLLPRGLEYLGRVARVYPGLRALRLEGPDLGHRIEERVRERLAALHGCEVEIRHHRTEVSVSVFGIGQSFVPDRTGFTIP